MRLSDLAPKKGSKKRPRRLGRGIAAGQGASCGFGMRGQNSRSGSGTRAGFEGGQTPLYRRIPKLKHFPLINPRRYTILNVGSLSDLAANTVVNIDFLLAEGILTSAKQGPLKILGDGELNVPLQVQAVAFSSQAKAKIEAAGGSCHMIECYDSRNRLKTETKTMTVAVIKNRNADNNHVYQKYSVHSGWLDIKLDSGFEDSSFADILTATIPLVNNTDVFSDTDIAKKYLIDFLNHPDLEIFKLYRERIKRYNFHEYYSEFIEYTNTFFVKFLQYYWNYEIYSSLATIEIDKHKKLLSMTLVLGMICDLSIPDTSKWINKEDIVKIVQEDGGFIDNNNIVLEALEALWYYDTVEEKWCLCYRLENIFISNEGNEENIDKMFEVYDYFINVLDGKIVDKISRIQ